MYSSHKVNGTSLLGATHLEAVRSLRGIGDDLTLLVCDGFDPADVPAGQHAAWQASPVASINSGKSQSQESLERDIIPSNERAYDDIRREIKRQVGGSCLFIHFVDKVINACFEKNIGERCFYLGGILKQGQMFALRKG